MRYRKEDRPDFCEMLLYFIWCLAEGWVLTVEDAVCFCEQRSISRRYLVIARWGIFGLATGLAIGLLFFVDHGQPAIAMVSGMASAIFGVAWLMLGAVINAFGRPND